VPRGCVGELYIGGAGVARGYLNQAELTAERFVPDPNSPLPGARMYRTGDLARHRTDGNLEFIGRNDDQVKVRGYRIELGEIEARLSQYPAIRESVVIAREDSVGEKRLVAYVTTTPVPHNDDAPATFVSALRRHLSEQLPDYMVPAAFVRLETLPLTPNGKIDRKALPAPDEQAVAQRPYEAPQGEIEVMLAAAWADLLSLERVGRNDNFFDLGGHSLVAVRLLSRLRQTPGVEVPMSTLFSKSTLAAFAESVEAALRQGRSQPLPSLTRLPRD